MGEHSDPTHPVLKELLAVARHTGPGLIHAWEVPVQPGPHYHAGGHGRFPSTKAAFQILKGPLRCVHSGCLYEGTKSGALGTSLPGQGGH